ncbi:transglycosylase domain-containing protein [Orbus sturtevantii]|uniref:transglycosylase domain-containing protein n=1 Tax=Orbus sturtevantii TaxID=3074109 RepID=UPI00370D9971
MVIVMVGYFYYSKDLPDVLQLKDVRLQTPMQILSSDGELIATFGERRRMPLKYDDIPPVVLNAVIATEDSRFYEHYGIDPIGILRSVYIGLKQGGFSQGGSTITQQVAKNFFLTPEKSLGRKIREMILAIRIEKELSKEEIIVLYLNMINFGSRAYGIGSAAYTFFGKDASELTLSEAALLAGLPNAPSAYNPISYPERALSRRNWVLHRMFEQGLITDEQYKNATIEPLGVKYYVPKIAFSAPYVAEMARQFMYDKFGEKAYTDGYKVYTTISKLDQIAATDAIRDNILKYDMRHGYHGPEKILWKSNEKAWDETQILSALNRYMCYSEICPAVVIKSNQDEATAILSNGNKITINFDGVKWARPYINDNLQGKLPTTVSSVISAGQQIWVKKQNEQWELSQIPIINGSLISINADNGQIKALVGGFNYNISKFNRATQAIRQIGSTIKPFIYTAALDKGLTMSTILNDAPIMRSNAGSDVWRPKNSPAVYQGPLRLRVGLSTSKNVMMVRTLRAIGVDYAADYLERFGFPRENISRHESLALGSASFTPLQVARAYSVLANGGYLITPYLIDRIEYSEGGIIYQHSPEIACSNCLDDRNEKPSNKVANLDNVENALDSSGTDEPEQSKLKADDNILLPDPSISFEGLINQNGSNVRPLDKNSGVIYAPHVISSEIAFIIKDALKSTVWGDPNGLWSGTAWRTKSLGRKDIGGKTGTTNASKDVWFAGFGANIVTTVWLGFDDHRRELGKARRDTLNDNSYIATEGGAVTANPLWNDYMKAALQDIPEQQETKPSSVVSILIDKKTGLLAPQPGTDAIMEYFILGTEPTKYPTQEVGTKVTDDQGNTYELF